MKEPLVKNVPGCQTTVERRYRKWIVRVNGEIVAVIPVRGTFALIDID